VPDSPASLEAQTLVVGFDLDLTLVDSRERIFHAYIHALRDVGVEVSREDLEPHMGIPLTHTVAAIAPAVDADALVTRYRRYYDDPSSAPTEPMPGAVEALTAVREQGGRAVVVSAKFIPAVHTALAEAGLTDLVDAVHGELFAEDKAGALVREGAHIFVGDHPGDMAAAAGADAIAVGVTTGSHDADALAAVGAAVTIPDLNAFPGWLSVHLTDR
jgi:phosphoglycolate phosphatase